MEVCLRRREVMRVRWVVSGVGVLRISGKVL